MAEKPIYVTRPYLPPLEGFIPALQELWDSRVLTNCGPFHQRFEAELCAFLGVDHVAVFANATLALLTALQALRISGEVITTPYSFVATSHALLWNGIKPVFADIDPISLNLDPARIEAAITPQTSAILPVHCYGHPAQVRAIERIADNYNLKVIYDAAHAFAVEDGVGSILRYGDLSVLSFHATKVFNTFEGGAIICPDAKTKTRIDQLKNFGFVGEVDVVAPGINGKMSEFNAALGLYQLKHVKAAIAQRQSVDARYRQHLETVRGIRCLSAIRAGDDRAACHETRANYAYFPILVEPDFPLSRDALNERLKVNNIYPRRYFYPLISDFPMYRGLPSAHPDNLPVATKAAQQILCLPIYAELEASVVDEICQIIKSA